MGNLELYTILIDGVEVTATIEALQKRLFSADQSSDVIEIDVAVGDRVEDHPYYDVLIAGGFTLDHVIPPDLTPAGRGRAGQVNLRTLYVFRRSRK